MAWFPISHTVPQYEDASGIPYSGAVLKAYAATTSTPINFATSSSGTTEVGSIALNASGFPAVSGNVVIPFVEEIYKLVLYPTQAAADANSGAIWTVDSMPIAGELFDSVQSISGNTALDSADDNSVIEASGTITIDLPALSAPIKVAIRNVGSGVITIDGDGAEQINGAATLAIQPGESLLIVPGTSAWTGLFNIPTLLINNFTAETTLQTADQIPFADSSASEVNKKITVANFITTLASTTSQSGFVEKATQAEVEAETAEKYPDAASLKYHPGVAKAWAYLTQSAGTYTVAANYNEPTFVDNGVGLLTMTIGTDMSSSNYAPGATPAAGNLIATWNTIAAGTYAIDLRISTSGGNTDTNFTTWAFGDQ